VKRVTTRNALRSEVYALRRERLRIGFVPTMGWLHAGHLSLIELARAHADRIVVSVFVNPLQFGPGEDFERYPRNLERDATLAETGGADLLFAPDTAELYPQGDPAVTIVAPALTDRLCGAYRPGHFEGVLTVVAKLFHIVQPDVAAFGQKDFQQLVLIQRMVQDLDLPVNVVAGPIVREADGLALSSRNVHLSAAERQDAALLSAALRDAQHAFSAGERDADVLIAGAAARLDTGAHVRAQYVALVDPGTLDPVRTAAPGSVLALAAHVGRTRLIDNHALT
jgi:pantoate--beta-alanine ligase